MATQYVVLYFDCIN